MPDECCCYKYSCKTCRPHGYTVPERQSVAVQGWPIYVKSSSVTVKLLDLYSGAEPPFRFSLCTVSS